MSTAAATLRGLLRAVHHNVTTVAGNQQWRAFIRARAREEAETQQLAQERLELAKDLTFLINNIRHHKALLTSYNIGIDPEERNKQMVEAVAKRVGFRLPDGEQPGTKSSS